MNEMFNKKAPESAPRSTEQATSTAPQPAPDQDLNTKSCMPSIDYAKATVDLIRDSFSLKGAQDILEMGANVVPGFKKIDNNTYTFQDLKFALTLTAYAERESAALRIANSAGVNAAPQLVENITFKNGDSVLITSRPNSGQDPPVRLKDWGGTVQPSAKAQFLDDMHKLAAFGYHLPDASKGTRDWEISPRSGDIVLANWSRLTVLEPQSALRVMQRFSDLLDRIG